MDREAGNRVAKEAFMASWRPLPELDELNGFFWRSGVDGKLRFLHCAACDYYIHPPLPLCPKCMVAEPQPKPVSGRATVRSVTINSQPWGPGLPPSYAIAIVGMDEQADLNLTTNIVGIAPEDVRIGARVQVVFEQREDVFVPLFEPLP
jgi:uncharacterized OB-fold protein